MLSVFYSGYYIIDDFVIFLKRDITCFTDSNPMIELSEILKSTLPNYPTCPVAVLVKTLTGGVPDNMTEKEVIDLLASIKKHEEELRLFRKLLERGLLNYQVESILRDTDEEN